MAKDISVELHAEITGFIRELRQAQGAAEKTMAGIKSAAGFATVALGGLGVAVGLRELVSTAGDAVDALDELGKSGQKAGVTAAAFGQLNYAAQLADVSTESLMKGLKGLNANLLQAAGGNTKVVAQFKALGFSAGELKAGTLDATGALERISAAFQTLPDGPTKSAIAVKLFGKAGADLIPLLNEGPAALRKYAAEAKAFGFAVSTDASKAAQEFNDALKKIGLAAKGATYQIAGPLLSAVVSIGKDMSDAADKGGKLSAVWQGLISTTSRSIGAWKGEVKEGSAGAYDELEKLIKKRDELLKPSAGARYSNTRQGGRGVLGPNLTQINAEIEAVGLKFGKLRQQEAELAAYEKKFDDERDKQAKKQADELAKTFADNNKNTQAEQLKKAEGDYIQKLRERLVAEQDVTEAAKVRLDIATGAAAQFSQPVKDEIVALAEEVDLLKESADVHKYLIDLAGKRAEEEEKAAKASSDAARKVYDDTRTPQEKLQRQIDELKQLQLDPDTYGRAVRKATDEYVKAEEQTHQLSASVKELGLTFTSAFEDAVVNGAKFSDVLQGIEKDILRLMARNLVTEPLMKGLQGLLGGTKAGSSGEGIGLGDIFSSAFSWVGGLFGGARAAGGPVSSSRAYLVGENGPELFMPRSSGDIIPNGAGGGVTVNVINQAGAEVQVKNRGSVNGQRQLDVFVMGSIGRAGSTGRGETMGISPPLVAR